MFGRRTRTLLPTSSQLLEPHVGVNNLLKNRKETQKYFHDKKGTNEKLQLKPGDVVRMQPQGKDNSKEWKKATVEKQVGIRSYNIATEDGGMYRRNRIHLRKTNDTPVIVENIEEPLKLNEERHVDSEQMTEKEITEPVSEPEQLIS